MACCTFARTVGVPSFRAKVRAFCTPLNSLTLPWQRFFNDNRAKVADLARIKRDFSVATLGGTISIIKERAHWRANDSFANRCVNVSPDIWPLEVDPVYVSYSRWRKLPHSVNSVLAKAASPLYIAGLIPPPWSSTMPIGVSDSVVRGYL